MWQMHDGWGWWMMMGWLWMVVIVGLIIWAVYAVVTRLEGGRERHQPDEPGALTNLERRYARGDITAEQFEEMASRLGYRDGPRTKST